MRRRLLPLIVTLLVLPLGGCGTSDREKYREDFRKAADRFHASVEKAGATVQSGAGLRERVPALRSFKNSVEQLASDLDGSRPPDDLKQANTEAVKELRTLGSDLSDYETAAVASDVSQARRMVPKLQADQTLLQKTLDELDRKVSG